MRAWILPVVLAAALLPRATFAAPTAAPSPTAAATRPATPTPPPATPTATPTAAPATPTREPTPTPARATATPQASAPAEQRPAATEPAGTEPPTPAAPATGAVQGFVFLDAVGDGRATANKPGLPDIEVTLTPTEPPGPTSHARSDSLGTLRFAGLAAGSYHLALVLPGGRAATTEAERDVAVRPGQQAAVAFGLAAAEPEPPAPDASATPGAETPTPPGEASPAGADAVGDDPADSDARTPAVDPSPVTDDSSEQVMALAAVNVLPLRFAEGRDLLAQVQRRVLGPGLVWLGVPFRSQIDGGEFQFVNCGPASLTMVLAAFGLEVGPSQVRDYLNALTDNYNPELGTSLDVLSRIAREAGLTPTDLLSARGGYRDWSTDAVRWHVQHGHPVITLVKYRNLPGHGRSISDFDHYIVVSGLTPNGFIYNDAAFATTLGYGLEISDSELEVAWDNASPQRHGVALSLAPDAGSLSFPELPRRRPSPTPSPRQSPDRSDPAPGPAEEAAEPPATPSPEPDEVAPTVAEPVESAPAAGAPIAAAPDPPVASPAPAEPPEPADAGTPMGLQLEPSDLPAYEPGGPGRVAPLLLLLLGAVWLLWAAWSCGGLIVRGVGGRVRPVRLALVALLSLARAALFTLRWS